MKVGVANGYFRLS